MDFLTGCWLLMQATQRILRRALSISEEQYCMSRICNLHRHAIHFFGKCSQQTGADEYGSSLVNSIGASLAWMLYEAQRHNEIHQMVAMETDVWSKTCAARLRSSFSTSSFIVNRSYLMNQHISRRGYSDNHNNITISTCRTSSPGDVASTR